MKLVRGISRHALRAMKQIVESAVALLLPLIGQNLARLGRRSRCFSRCVHALRRAVKLFAFAWNRRQLYRQHYPKYPAHLINFCIFLMFTTPVIKQVLRSH